MTGTTWGTYVMDPTTTMELWVLEGILLAERPHRLGRVWSE